MDNYWLTEAIKNNAVWCDAMATSHGLSPRWTKTAWVSDLPVPPMYPNIVTLNHGADVEKLILEVDQSLPQRWGIKDSYKELDLRELGFAVAFEAQWYCRAPDTALANSFNAQLNVLSVRGQADLKRWVATWGENTDIFKMSLLDNPTIELIYIEHEGQVIAGMATNQSGGSTGISNLFGSDDGIAGCIAHIVKNNPSKGIVGYGGETEVTSLAKLGFNRVGDLQIWLRNKH